VLPGRPERFLGPVRCRVRDVAASNAKAVHARLDSRAPAKVIQPKAEGYSVFIPAGKLITRWKNEFVRSKVGSRYAIIANGPTEGSAEVTRKVITDLREWWPRRS
jgi:hypothetical protein